MTKPYKTTPQSDNLGDLVDATKQNLRPAELTLPKDDKFVEKDEFYSAYQELYVETRRFEILNSETVWRAYDRNKMVFIVIRSLIGLLPREWAKIANEQGLEDITEDFIKDIDKKIRKGEIEYHQEKTKRRLKNLFSVTIEYIETPVPETEDGAVNKLDLAGRVRSSRSIQDIAENGVPLREVLWERSMSNPLGRHNNAVSEVKGDIVEDAVEELLQENNIPYYRTEQVENVDGFDDTTDFYIPGTDDPEVLIEAKLVNDEGTANKQMARVSRLVKSSDDSSHHKAPYQVIACIDGVGFGRRDSELKKLINSVEGNVFTLSTLGDMIEYTKLSKYTD